jgi:transcriptional regulator
MYVPNQHRETDLATLHALIAAHPLGTWVTLGDGELIANYIPFLIDSSRGELGTLIGHVARANPVWQSFSANTNSVIVFQGSNSYITPSWYPSKHPHTARPFLLGTMLSFTRTGYRASLKIERGCLLT